MNLENVDTWGYTAQYEYACSLVKMFLEREAKLDKNNEDHVYGVGIIRALFTADYSMILDSNVYSSIIKNLNPDPKNETSFDILNRLRNLYIDVASALGYDFIKTLKTNVLEGLTSLGVSNVAFKGNAMLTTYKEVRKQYEIFLTDYPLVLMCIMGCKEYSINLLQKRRMSQNRDTVRTSP